MHKKVLYQLENMRKNNESTNAFLIHICAFAGFAYPFGSIITPLIAWQTLKDRSQFLDNQGKEAVNFNISYSLYLFILSVIFVPFALGTFFRNFNNFNDFEMFPFNFDFNSNLFFGFIGFGSITGLIMIIKVTLIVIAALKAKNGENYKYPFTIKFIK